MARGDHLRVKRAGGLYTHHGIDMGDGTVVHFSGEPTHFRNARICRVTLELFLEGGEAEVVITENALPVDETLAKAEESIGKSDYDVWMNNCEHFATWCKTGRHESRQSRRAIKAVVTVTVAGAVLLGHAAFRVLRRQQERARRSRM